jgi:hypothetical protein
MPELTLRDCLSILGLALVIVAFVLAVRSRRRKNKNALADLGTSDSPRIVRVGGKDLDFAQYIIKYLSQGTIQAEYVMTKDRAIHFIAITTDKLRYSYVFETGETLVIDDVPTFYAYVADELRKKEIIPKSITDKW